MSPVMLVLIFLRAEHILPPKRLGTVPEYYGFPGDTQHLRVSLGLPSQLVLHYVEVELSVFRSTDIPFSILGDLVFGADDQERIKYMFWQNNLTTEYIKSPWCFSRYLIWKRSYLRIPGRIHYTLVMLAALTFIWWITNWDLL